MSDFRKLKEHLNAQVKLELPAQSVLRPCLFCGSEEMSLLGREAQYGLTGAWVRCGRCGACGPVENTHAFFSDGELMCTPMTPESLEKGKTEAVTSWNLIANRRRREEYREAIL